jgi:hypothetical protein
VSTAGRRRALDEREPLREEHAHERAGVQRRQAGDRAAVDAQALRLAGLEAGLQSMADLLVARVDDHAADGGAAAHQLALVRRARRRPGTTEVGGLEQVRLAGAVGADHHGQPWGQVQLGRLVVAEVA